MSYRPEMALGPAATPSVKLVDSSAADALWRLCSECGPPAAAADGEDRPVQRARLQREREDRQRGTEKGLYRVAQQDHYCESRWDTP